MSKGLLFILILLGLYFGYQHVYDKGKEEGIQITNQQWEQRVVDVKREVEERYNKQRDILEATVKASNQKLVESQIEYENQKREAQAEADRIIDSVRADNKRLRIEVRASRNQTSPCTVTAATASTPRTRETAELSENASRFLIQQATSADNDVRLLNMCKRTLREYRNVVDKYNQQLKK